jgi:hypothetical protein
VPASQIRAESAVFVSAFSIYSWQFHTHFASLWGCGLFYIHCVRRRLSISIYMCYIVTEPGNLIKLFVNELVAPTRVQGNRQCCVCVLEHVLLRPPLMLLKFSLI